MKLLRDLLFAAALCFAFTSCDKDDLKPSEMILGSWEPVASESWDIEVTGETSNYRTWKEGDNGPGTLSMFQWMILYEGGKGRSNRGDITWVLDEDSLTIKYWSNSSAFMIILEYGLVKLSGKTLTLEGELLKVPSGGTFYEKVTYGKK